MLKEVTEQLYAECDRSWTRFMKMREEEKEADFFGEVKPYADQIHQQLAQWKELSQDFIQQHKPKHVHMVQINNASDAIEQFVVQSFYIKTSKKRFYQSIQSVKYTCETYLRAIKDTEHD